MYSLPTLLISECVLIYLDPVHSDAIVRWATDSLQLPVFVLYEQILPGDPFGEVMIRNLQVRLSNCHFLLDNHQNYSRLF